MKVTAVSDAKLTVNRSRFFARVFPARAVEDAKVEVTAARGRVRKGRHHCWAVRILVDGREEIQMRDDGEVGRPGAVLLEVLRRHDLEGGIVVSRVFGGVKLGTGGVSRAFRDAGEMAVEALLGER
jgi:putative IMPACT (imprinted ancient) family translation regulator